MGMEAGPGMRSGGFRVNVSAMMTMVMYYGIEGGVGGKV